MITEDTIIKCKFTKSELELISLAIKCLSVHCIEYATNYLQLEDNSLTDQDTRNILCGLRGNIKSLIRNNCDEV